MVVGLEVSLSLLTKWQCFPLPRIQSCFLHKILLWFFLRLQAINDFPTLQWRLQSQEDRTRRREKCETQRKWPDFSRNHLDEEITQQRGQKFALNRKRHTGRLSLGFRERRRRLRNFEKWRRFRNWIKSWRRKRSLSSWLSSRLDCREETFLQTFRKPLRMLESIFHVKKIQMIIVRVP